MDSQHQPVPHQHIDVEYRMGLDGSIYTWEEFAGGMWFGSASEESKRKNWQELDPIDIPEGKLEETKALMKYLHANPLLLKNFTIFVRDPNKILKIQ